MAGVGGSSSVKKVSSGVYKTSSAVKTAHRRRLSATVSAAVPAKVSLYSM